MTSNEGPPPSKRPILWKFWIKLILSSALVFVFSLTYFITTHEVDHNSIVKEEGSQDEFGEKIQTKVEQFEVVDSKEKIFRLDDFKGKVLVVTFWASWCMPCLVELPTFESLYQNLKESGLEILAVNMDEPSDAEEFIPKFWSENQLTFKNYFDKNEKASEAFEVRSLPTTFVIDRQGKLIAKSVGANDWSDPKTYQFLLDLF